MHFIKRYVDYLKDNPQRYWFKRKLFGWGWTPATWEGWLATFVFIAFVLWRAIEIDSLAHSASDTLYAFGPEFVVALIVFIVLAWRTGEPPKWQWGFPKKDTE